MADRGTGGKILSLTVKRARRVQEKMMQKLGKSDQTKDEVFQDFVNNFNRQSAAASKIQKELTRFMNAIRVLSQCTRSLGETLSELYEPEWAGHDKYDGIFKSRKLLWEDLLTSLQSRMVEPMNNYISKFPEVKSRIQKRERKVVDYDLRRRELEALKTKQKVTDQKLQQAEELYSQTKLLYDEITDELYEELPTFFDSRIQFYASIFQSIAATEARFHSEIAKVDEDFAGLMDGLASEAATAIHTTKKERALDSTPKLMSRPGEESDSDNEAPPSPSHDLSTTAETNNINDDSSGSTPSSTTPTHINNDSNAADMPVNSSRDGGSLRRQPPSKPVRSNSFTDETPPQTASDYEPVAAQTSEENAGNTPPSPVSQSPITSFSEKSKPPLPHGKSTATEVTHPYISPLHKDLSDADLAELDSVIESTTKSEPLSPPTSPPMETEEPISSSSLKEYTNILYKVMATHPYQGEDDDELSFEKGDVILVVPYEDPDDEEEGWRNGISESSGKKGIFPENFTKKLDS